MKPKILVIVGPTASGKSALAIKLAKALAVESEIVSADSRQVYRDLDIGSGKVTKREMAGIPHHMLDIANPKRIFSVSQYQKLAYKAIDSIIARGKLPIIVGGTGLYVDAITKNQIFPSVSPNPKLRKELEKLETKKLFQILGKLDSERARTIDRHNPRRLIRAIEIAKAIGKLPPPPVIHDRRKYVVTTTGIKVPPPDLRAKIHERLVKRMKAGMMTEIKNLHTGDLSWKRLEQLGLEYRYGALYLQGKLGRQEMLIKLESKINHYAKRQMTWFKRDKSIAWISP